MKFLGTGSALPKKVVSNDDLAQVMDTSDEWIRSRTGIGMRHIAVEENNFHGGRGGRESTCRCKNIRM